jgi:hypothetical protein
MANKDIENDLQVKVDIKEVSIFSDQVRDAVELLEFAVSAGYDISKRIIDEISRFKPSQGTPAEPSSDKIAEFYRAYRDLTIFMQPITIDTLRATTDKDGHKRHRLLIFSKISEARIWARKLWYTTIVFIIVALFSENLQTVLTGFFPADEESSQIILNWHLINSIFQSITPFIYGGIGALAFLLRSCHEHIRNREFDVNRIPEYISRIFLGVVSGGTISLFIQEIAGDGGAIRLSAAALGFLAGYNNDFLFKTIERIAEAILPKVGIETMRKAMPKTSAYSVQEVFSPVSVEKLMELHQSTQDPETKKFIESLINNLTEAK